MTDRAIDILRSVQYVAAVIGLIASVVALPINVVGEQWRVAAFNVGCIAICSLFFLDRRA